MHTFLHGWRRKAGCVVLVMACIMCGAWVRSINHEDAARFSVAGRRHLLRLSRENVEWHAWKERSTDPPMPGWASTQYRQVRFVSARGQEVSQLIQLDVDDDLQSTPRDLAHARFFKPQERRLISWSIPCWSVAIPPILLSAYLILRKPRKRL